MTHDALQQKHTEICDAVYTFSPYDKARTSQRAIDNSAIAKEATKLSIDYAIDALKTLDKTMSIFDAIHAKKVELELTKSIL